MPNMNVFIAAMRCEWRILRLDPALWLVLAMILATVAYALHNGKTSSNSGPLPLPPRWRRRRGAW